MAFDLRAMATRLGARTRQQPWQQMYQEQPLPDVEGWVSRYEKGLQPYYEAATERTRRAIQQQLGQRQRQLGEQFQSRGLYGTGLYGRGLANLYGTAMREQEGALSDLEMQRLQSLASRREAIQNMLWGAGESQRQRLYGSHEALMGRLYDWQKFQKQLQEQRKQRQQAGFASALGTLFGAGGQALGALTGGVTPPGLPPDFGLAGLTDPFIG